jgi:hypothetical protein
MENRLNITYYFSTHGCSRVWSSFPSVGFCFELVDAAAAAAARALLLKKLEAMSSYSKERNVLKLSNSVTSIKSCH